MLRWVVIVGWLHCGLLDAEALLTLTFDPPTISGGDAIISEYVEDDMAFFTETVLFHRDSSADDIYPDNGSAYLAFASLMEPLVITNTQGQLFDLISVDVSEYSTLNAAFEVPVTGYRPDGSSVTTVLTLDLVQDGTGPLPDFETFTLGGSFTGLTHVEIAAVGYALDNVSVNVVPEPSTGLLLLAGGGAMCWWGMGRPRRRKPLQSPPI